MELPRDPEIVYAGTKLCPAISYMHHGPYAGWVFCRHPDGQWVTLGRLYPEELTEYEKNKLDHPAMQRMADDHLKETELLTRRIDILQKGLEIITSSLKDGCALDAKKLCAIATKTLKDAEECK